MLDMAVGIIIGTAFNNVVNTMVKKVIMPPLAMLTDGVHIKDKKYVIRPATEDVQEIAIEYGEMIEVGLDFIIIAFTVFIFIKFFNSLREKAYHARIKSETDKLKEVVDAVLSDSKSEEPVSKEVVEEKKTSEETYFLKKIKKLLQEQNKILQKQK